VGEQGRGAGGRRAGRRAGATAAPRAGRGSGPRRRAVAGLSVGVLALSGCGSLELLLGAPGDAETTAAAPEPLVVGLLTSPEGTAGRFAPLVRYGVEEALDDVNDDGGVLGAEVGLVEVEAGTAPADAVAALSEGGATVVVTAVPDAELAELVPLAAEAGITVLSATSRSAGLDGISDAGYLFRLTATDSTVEPWLVEKALGDGGRLAYVARDEAASRARAERLGPALATSGGELVSATLYPAGGTDHAAAAAAVLDAGATVVLVDGGEETVQVLAALTQQAAARKQAEDGFKAPAILIGPDGTEHYGSALAPEALRGATGTRPAAPPSDDFVNRILNHDVSLTGFPYAAPGYDAAAVAVLAAAEGGASDGSRIAQHVATTLADGEKCTDPAACLELVAAGADLDYDGASGELELGPDGDPVLAQLTTYSFTDGNTLDGASAVAVERAAD
jgi:neutral amino acid transport system substrate-binding protein